MAKIKINMREPYKTFVLKGIKTVEGRLNKGKFAKIKVGDVMEIKSNKTSFNIIRKNVYSSFREMIEKEGIKNVVPDKNNLEDAVNVYYNFFTKEQEKEFQVLAIEIKMKKENL